MFHKLSVYFLTWPTWIKMLLLIALTSLTMTAVVLAISSMIEIVRYTK